MQYVKYLTKHLCLAIYFVAILSACSNHDEQSQALTAELKQQYGLEVRRLTDKNQLPSSVVFKIKDGEALVKIKQLKKGQFYQYIKILKKALAKYPPSLVRNTLTEVFIGGPYTENDAIIVGMYGNDKIYLFYNHKWGDNTPLFLEQTFHHEFSSILIKKYNFPAFDWLKLNPKHFSYIINPRKIDKYMNSVGNYSASEAMLKDGVVTAYGMVNAENDINTYAETMFTQPEKMKNYIDKYPVIARKYAMLKDFYLSISPGFGKIFALIDKQ
jgi:hypothetical protein